MTISEVSDDEGQRLWELYVSDCYQRGEVPRVDQFTIWLEESH